MATRSTTSPSLTAPASRAKPEPAPETPAPRSRAARMDPQARQDMIIDRAIAHFAAEGFVASTRELARKIGVTQSLLYRYFPTKEALLDKVYDRVYVGRWNPMWEVAIKDRGVPVEARLKQFYTDYSRAMVQDHWVRILIFAGLKQAGINERLFSLLRERIYKVIIEELRAEMALPKPRKKADSELELELVWGLHASIFYLGMRRYVYHTAVPRNLDPLIESLVEGFILSFQHHALKHAARA